MYIQCTNKLQDELAREMQPSDADALHCWHAHLFLHQRRKCVLLMNNATRYNFVLYGLIKKDFKAFEELIKESVRENMIADGMQLDTVERYMQGCSRITYGPTSDRSIISQMNEMIMIAKLELDRPKELGMDMYKVNRYLNRFIMLKLPQSYSGEAMKEALASY